MSVMYNIEVRWIKQLEDSWIIEVTNVGYQNLCHHSENKRGNRLGEIFMIKVVGLSYEFAWRFEF